MLPHEDRESARTRGTIEREDRYIRRTAVVHRTALTAEIRAAVGTKLPQRGVRNWLLQEQLRARRLVASIPLTHSHCRL
ncbi:HTH_Tnp_Tc3_2 domain-containing protein [Trichonephila clavipes]|nr:HTH_Tnp_Tc3_2 domain-containing protein [Trichonephila clavipes]